MHNLNTFVLAYLPYIIVYLNTSFLYFYTFIGIYLYISILAYTCILACTCIRAYLHSCILAYFLRGGVTKKNGKRGQGYCNQSLKINTIIPAITSLSGNVI